MEKINGKKTKVGSRQKSVKLINLWPGSPRKTEREREREREREKEHKLPISENERTPLVISWTLTR